jgi:hypothetical protein
VVRCQRKRRIRHSFVVRWVLMRLQYRLDVIPHDEIDVFSHDVEV